MFQTTRTQSRCSVITKGRASTHSLSSRWSCRTRWRPHSQTKSIAHKQPLILIIYLTRRGLTISRAMQTWSSKCKKSNLLRSLKVAEEIIPGTVKSVWSILLGSSHHHLLISMMLARNKKCHQQSQWSSKATRKLSEEATSARPPPKSLQKEKI